MDFVEGVAVAIGWRDPQTGELKPFKLIIPKYVVDTDIPHPDTIANEEKKMKLIEALSDFNYINVNGKVRFFIYDDDQANKLNALLQKLNAMNTTNVVKIPAKVSKVIKRIGKRIHKRDVVVGMIKRLLRG